MSYDCMDLDRLNPVILISGATSGIGAACSRVLAPRAEGGLILVDGDADALDTAADALEKAPERVSLLAIDVMDQARWRQAAEFVSAQYGRLDCALINTIDGGAIITDRRIKNRKQGAADLEAAAAALRALLPLLGANALGGAVVIIAPASTLHDAANGLAAFVRAAAKEAAGDTITVNAIAIGRCDSASVRRAPMLQDLVQAAGNDRVAIERIAGQAAPLARAPGGDIAALVALLISAPATGVILVVDAAPAL